MDVRKTALRDSASCGLGGRMISLFGENACSQEGNGSTLGRILRPILPDLEQLQGRLAETLSDTHDRSVREVVDYLLETPGKRLRPALTLLSARAARGTGNGSPRLGPASLNVAAAVELIHMASLVHDDLVDTAMVRHHRPAVPAKWGRRVAAAVGDHLCGKAFRLVADCADPRLFAILGLPLCAMCDGELLQVAWRGDFNLSEETCLAMVEKKTAALFSACCAAGATTAVRDSAICDALRKYGYHFGIAFQILDDCRDLLSDEERLGKTPGQDLLAGDVTLPLMYVIKDIRPSDRGLLDLSRPGSGGPQLTRLSEAFHSSSGPRRIAQLVASHLGRARRQLLQMADSDFKVSLLQLTDHLARSTSDVLAR